MFCGKHRIPCRHTCPIADGIGREKSNDKFRKLRIPRKSITKHITFTFAFEWTVHQKICKQWLSVCWQCVQVRNQSDSCSGNSTTWICVVVDNVRPIIIRTNFTNFAFRLYPPSGLVESVRCVSGAIHTQLCLLMSVIFLWLPLPRHVCSSGVWLHDRLRVTW